MNTVKIMSLIGIILFIVCFFGMSATMESDLDAAIGFGSIAAMYGIGFSITAFVQMKKALKVQA